MGILLNFQFFWGGKRSWYFKQYGEDSSTCLEENCVQGVLIIWYINYFSLVHFQYQGLTEPYWWCWDTGWGTRGGRGRRSHNCMISPAQGAANGPLMSLVLLIPVSVLALLWLLPLSFESKTFLKKSAWHITERLSELTLWKRDHVVVLLLSVIIPEQHGRVFLHMLNLSE